MMLFDTWIPGAIVFWGAIVLIVLISSYFRLPDAREPSPDAGKAGGEGTVRDTGIARPYRKWKRVYGLDLKGVRHVFRA